jgi:hypothetical protein
MASMRDAQGELAARQIHLLATKPRDKTVAAPQFDIAAIDKTPGPLDRLGIIGAQQRLEPYKMPIKPDRINPVFRHPQSPPQNISGRNCIHRFMAMSARYRTRKSHGMRAIGLRKPQAYALSLSTRSISDLASLMATTRLTGVAPILRLPSANLISHRQPAPSVN